jgi:hypothetical protein
MLPRLMHKIVELGRVDRCARAEDVVDVGLIVVETARGMEGVSIVAGLLPSCIACETVLRSSKS